VPRRAAEPRLIESFSLYPLTGIATPPQVPKVARRSASATVTVRRRPFLVGGKRWLSAPPMPVGMNQAAGMRCKLSAARLKVTKTADRTLPGEHKHATSDNGDIGTHCR
jgi:hypothetical protein